MTEQLSHFSFSYFKKYYKIKPQKRQIKAKKKIRKKKKTNQVMTVFRDKTQDLNGEEKD